MCAFLIKFTERSHKNPTKRLRIAKGFLVPALLGRLVVLTLSKASGHAQRP